MKKISMFLTMFFFFSFATDALSQIVVGTCVCQVPEGAPEYLKRRFEDISKRPEFIEPATFNFSTSGECTSQMPSLCKMTCMNKMDDLLHDSSKMDELLKDRKGCARYKWTCSEKGPGKRVWSPFAEHEWKPVTGTDLEILKRTILPPEAVPGLVPVMDNVPSAKDNFADHLYRNTGYALQFTPPSDELIEQASKTTAIGVAGLIVTTILYRVMDLMTAGAVTSSSFILMEQGCENGKMIPNNIGNHKNMKQTACTDDLDIDEYCKDLETEKPICDLPGMGTFAIKLKDEGSLLLFPLDAEGPNS